MASSTMSHRLGTPAISTASTRANSALLTCDAEAQAISGLRLLTGCGPGTAYRAATRHYAEYSRKNRDIGSHPARRQGYARQIRGRSGLQRNLLDSDGVDRANRFAAP